jgi:hypothetical protein
MIPEGPGTTRDSKNVWWSFQWKMPPLSEQLDTRSNRILESFIFHDVTFRREKSFISRLAGSMSNKSNDVWSGEIQNAKAIFVLMMNLPEWQLGHHEGGDPSNRLVIGFAHFDTLTSFLKDNDKWAQLPSPECGYLLQMQRVFRLNNSLIYHPPQTVGSDGEKFTKHADELVSRTAKMTPTELLEDMSLAGLSALFNFASFRQTKEIPTFKMYSGLCDPNWLDGSTIDLTLFRLINDFSLGRAHCTSTTFFSSIIEKPNGGLSVENSCQFWNVHVSDGSFFYGQYFKSFTYADHEDLEWIILPVHRDGSHYAWVVMNVIGRYAFYGDSLRYPNGHGYLKVGLHALRHHVEVILNMMKYLCKHFIHTPIIIDTYF